LSERELVVEGEAAAEDTVDADAEVEAEEAGGKTRSSTSQTTCQNFQQLEVSTPLNKLTREGLTLIGVASGALVGLRTIVPLIQALISTGHSNSVVSGEVPRLLRRAGV
jgi:hypothetical protein